MPSSNDLLSMVGDLSQALHAMLACQRCYGAGSVGHPLGIDECPVCHGYRSTLPIALKHVESVAARCEEFSQQAREGEAGGASIAATAATRPGQTPADIPEGE